MCPKCQEISDCISLRTLLTVPLKTQVEIISIYVLGEGREEGEVSNFLLSLLSISLSILCCSTIMYILCSVYMCWLILHVYVSVPPPISFAPSLGDSARGGVGWGGRMCLWSLALLRGGVLRPWWGGGRFGLRCIVLGSAARSPGSPRCHSLGGGGGASAQITPEAIQYASRERSRISTPVGLSAISVPYTTRGLPPCSLFVLKGPVPEGPCCRSGAGDPPASPPS